MKKNYTAPNLKISVFMTQNVVMTSGITAEQSVRNNSAFTASESNTQTTSWSEMLLGL